jgi:hypothetical protein
MKNTPRFLLFLLTLSVILLSACNGAPSPAIGEDSNVNDSSVTPVVVDDNGNSSSDTNSNDTNSNDTNSNSNNSSDDSSNSSDVEVFGVVESMTETTITVNGVTYNIIADLTEFKDVISVGDQVKIHVIVNADGTFTIREIEMSVEDANGNDNSNDANSIDDNSNDANSNDDNGNDSNSNEDNGSDSNSNDDSSNNNNGGNNNDSSGSGSGGNGNDDSGGNDNDSNDNG